MRLLITASALALAVLPVAVFARPIGPEDQLKEQMVGDPQIAPDGSAVAYTVTTYDTAADQMASHIWLAPWDGAAPRQLTGRAGESESGAKFSPDGKTLGFLSSRADKDKQGETRLWLLPMNGGEAKPLDGIAGSVDDFAFSPDGKYLALIVSDKQPDLGKDSNGDEIPAPIVVDRYHFKVDDIGILDNRRQRLFLYDLAAGTMKRMTDGDYDEYLPAWSPDSTKVAFASKRAPDPDRTYNSDIFIAAVAMPGAAPFRLTTYEGADVPQDAGAYPAWSPDGKQIAYIRNGDPKLIYYAANTVAVIPSTGGEPRLLTKDLDRNTYFSPVWTPDGKAIRFVLEDDGKQVLASVSPNGGAVSRLAEGEFVVASPTIAKNGHTALLQSSPRKPFEVYAFDAGKLRPLSHQNDDWLKEIDFGQLTFNAWKGPDGTEVHGFILTPPASAPGVAAGQKLKTILHPHGGPAAQYDWSFDMWQNVFAGAGFVVLTPNPRGSTGRGTAYANALNAAWGGVDVPEDLALVDLAVSKGISDPDRLVVGGWSYGGMATNYLIASDTRFKAAMAGASIGNVFAGYGTDQYVLDYDTELGVPWKNLDVWIKNSYPFLHADRIKTPTLYMVGGADVNVPTLASEQMYQALKTQGIDSELVIYPDQYHHFTRPSYVVDRMKRWLAWYDKYLK
ncbi:MAG: S9 family peptidase [Novosphingobium sp.]|nr:S9 family peptidase [Novosphingobium sp.]MBO9602978.1 S9 family peptidase [Novosphingobium sp.]